MYRETAGDGCICRMKRFVFCESPEHEKASGLVRAWISVSELTEFQRPDQKGRHIFLMEKGPSALNADGSFSVADMKKL